MRLASSAAQRPVGAVREPPLRHARHSVRVVHALGLLLLLPVAACAQAGNDAISQAVPEATLAATLEQPGNVVELSDGRIALADTKGRWFLYADLATGKVDTIGRRTDSLRAATTTPGEYKLPGWVVHLAGDTVAVVDFAALQTLLWNERGTFLAQLPKSEAGGYTPMLAFDHIGFGYKADYRGVMGGAEPGIMVHPESIPVLRIRLRDGTADTIAQLATPEYGEARIGEQTQQVAKVFAANDQFGVLPDGSMWVARGRTNRVDWRNGDGRWLAGRSRAYRKVAVAQADRDRVMQQLKERGLPTNVAVSFPFAEQKPPFENVLASPEGEVWLQRSRADLEAPNVYDVVGRDGVWRRAVGFPKGATLAGFGRNNRLYAVLKTGNGGRTIGRFSVK